MRHLLSFSLFLVLLTVPLSLLAATRKNFVVVIDAGHGGKDYGAYRDSYREKDINLAVALRLGELIKQNMPDVRVIFTRTTDVFVELDQRAAIANKAKANLFISIHTNSTGSSTTAVSGAETYILGLARSKENLEVAKRENSVILLEDDYSQKYEGFDPKSPESNIIFEFMTNKYMEQSYEMGRFVQNEFKRNTNQRDKGVKQAGFLVLRKTAMPSLLVEVGFVNNPRDASYITSKSGQNDLAQAIYSAFHKYKRELDQKQGNLVISSKEDKVVSTDSSQYNRTSIDSSKEDKQERTSSQRPNKSTSRGIEYRVQIYTSPQKLSTNSPKFKNLSPIDYYVDGGNYKYTYGVTSNLNEAIALQKKARKYFKDAFVIKFRNGKRAN